MQFLFASTQMRDYRNYKLVKKIAESSTSSNAIDLDVDIECS